MFVNGKLLFRLLVVCEKEVHFLLICIFVRVLIKKGLKYLNVSKYWMAAYDDDDDNCDHFYKKT